MNNFSSNFSKIEIKEFKYGMRLPEVKISPEQRAAVGLKEDASNLEYLKKLIWNGCQEKIASGKIKQDKNVCIARLKEEFKVFELVGVTDYFLFLYDILSWADQQGIPRGPSRGSCSGSFALYCLGLINISALDHNLTFSRFLSTARAKPQVIDGVTYCDGKSFCDVDCDISQRGRGKVLSYIEEKYPGRVSKILTVQKLTGKMALKDTMKIFLAYSEDQAMEISSNVESVFGKVDSINKTYEINEKFKQWADKNKECVDIAKKIENLQRGLGGVHASGVLVSYYPLVDIIPTQLSEKGVVSGFTMSDALSIIIKGDFLGLLTLDLLKECQNLTGVKYSDIDINDQSIYNYLQSSDCYYGLFQISEGVTKRVVQRVRPKTFDHINSCLSIGRPGSIRFIGDYCEYLATGKLKSIDSRFDKILENTGGLIIFQESINRICQEIYKISPEDSDKIRAAISKKKREEMDKWEPVIKEHGKQNNVSNEVTDWFLKACHDSADYLFSENHSRAYSMITAYTTYYKANYTSQFYLACLKLAGYESDTLGSISKITQEMSTLGIKLLPPDIIKSDLDFKIEDNNIRFGLSHIKGISSANIEKLLNFKREDTTTKFQLFEVAQQCSIPINVLTGLIYCGCLDGKGQNRARLVLEAQTYNILTNKEKILVAKLAPDFNEDLLAIIKELTVRNNEKGKPYIKESRFGTIKKKYDPYKQIYLQNSRNEELCSYIMERTFLGFSYSSSLIKIYSPKYKNLRGIADCNSEPKDIYIKFAAFIDEVKTGKTKAKGTPYLKLTVSDETGSANIMIFGEEKIKNLENFNNKELEEGQIIVVEGKSVGDSTYFIDSVFVQEVPIKIKVGDLKKEITI